MVAPYAAGSSSAAGGLGAGASHTGYQHARTPQRGDQAANLCRAHLPQLRRLSTPRSSPCRRNSRELARGPPLPQYERSQGAQENPISPSRIDQPKMTAFAELDAHNRRFPFALTDKVEVAQDCLYGFKAGGGNMGRRFG